MFSSILVKVPVSIYNCMHSNIRVCYLSSLNYINSLNSWPKSRFKILEGQFNISPNKFNEFVGLNATVNEVFEEKRKKALNGGGDSAILQHTQRNKKILARKRIELLVDPNYPLLEIGLFSGLGLNYGDICCSGLIVVIGKISNQLCIISASDATVKGGAIYPIGVKKQTRMQEIGAENNLPCVYIIDSGGGFLPLQAEVFNPGGKVFCNEAVMNASGVPQICVVAGSCTAGAAYIPTMSNEVVMIDKISSIFLAGPPLVFAATGEQISEQDLGGASVHCKISGCADYMVKNEIEALEITKDIMSTLNMKVFINEHMNIEEPIYDIKDLSILQFARNDNGCLFIKQILSRVVDGSRFHEYKPYFGTSILTGYARINGILVGILANNGSFTPDGCLKGSNFVSLCNERGIPLIFFQDIMENNSKDETQLIKYISQLMTVVATAHVPKITILIGNSFGAGHYAMCGRSMSPRFLFRWPDSKLCIGDFYDKEMHQNFNEKEIKNNNALNHYEFEKSSYYGSARLWDDGVVLPQDTRSVLSLALNACLTHKQILCGSVQSVLRM